jgi:site-specific DNA-methyltransferase (adenine-specific)
MFVLNAAESTAESAADGARGAAADTTATSPLTAEGIDSSASALSKPGQTGAAGGEVALVVVEHGDCRDIMAAMEAESIDALVGDPPYGLGFMGKAWDHGVPGVEFWATALRVAKPGAYLLMAGGTRTYHRLACAIEDAGWEIRDCISWIHGQGFPKSLNVSKAIDALLGADRPVVGVKQERAHDIRNGHGRALGSGMYAGEDTPRLKILETSAGSDEAREWEGWGTALKPAVEPFVLARKPLGTTVARRALEHGTGALNIGGCMVGSDPQARTASTGVVKSENACMSGPNYKRAAAAAAAGRWPANIIHDGSDEVVELFGSAAGQLRDIRGDEPQTTGESGIYGRFAGRSPAAARSGEGCSAARFFYCAKPTTREREAGLGEIEAVRMARVNGGGGLEDDPKFAPVTRRNTHPTVKPIALMRYLVRLVSRPGALVLDPFAGSGTTGCACALEGRRFVGCELDERYVAIARARVAYWTGIGIDTEKHDPAQLKLFGGAA